MSDPLSMGPGPRGDGPPVAEAPLGMGWRINPLDGACATFGCNNQAQEALLNVNTNGRRVCIQCLELLVERRLLIANIDRRVGPPERRHSHYFKDVSGLEVVDVYRVLLLFAVSDPCLQHAIKKLLVAGGRGGGKDIRRDIQEAMDTLARWQEIQSENEGGKKA